MKMRGNRTLVFTHPPIPSLKNREGEKNLRKKSRRKFSRKFTEYITRTFTSAFVFYKSFLQNKAVLIPNEKSNNRIKTPTQNDMMRGLLVWNSGGN